MASLKRLARQVLNLPESRSTENPNNVPSDGEEQYGAAPQFRGKEDSRRSSSKLGNPWLDAAEKLNTPSHNIPQSQTTSRDGNSSSKEDPPPWSTASEKNGTVAAQRFGRGLLWTVVALAAITGIRSWFWPNEGNQVKVQQSKTEPSYPIDQAKAVAGRWARSYLTWDSKHPHRREKDLAADMPDGVDTSEGWNGKGNQEVIAIDPGTVKRFSKVRARVRVNVLTSTKKKEESGKTRATHWVGLEVPVARSQGRIVVTGPPGVVGMPKPATNVPKLPEHEDDPSLTSKTEGTVTDFFKAYADGGVEQVSAPGTDIPPLPGHFAFDELKEWSLRKGKNHTRTGTAVVSWSVSDAVIDETYRVELTRVSSQDGSRWQVSALHGGAS